MSDRSLFKWRHFDADIILCAVRWYLRYALSDRDVEELLTPVDAARLHHADWKPAGAALRLPRQWRHGWWAAVVVAALMTLAAVANQWLRTTTFESIPPSPVPLTGLFKDPIPIAVTVSAAGQHAPWITTEEEARGSVEP